MSTVLPPVKESIYIPALFGFLGDEGNQRAGTGEVRGGWEEDCRRSPWGESVLVTQGESVSGRRCCCPLFHWSDPW